MHFITKETRSNDTEVNIRYISIYYAIRNIMAEWKAHRYSYSYTIKIYQLLQEKTIQFINSIEPRI